MLELGAVPPRGTVPDKEYQIGYFKRGFATHIEDQIVWRWSSPTCDGIDLSAEGLALCKQMLSKWGS
ncbi:MAG: hypothetical protein WA322_05145 [Pseudolabrys sp.]